MLAVKAPVFAFADPTKRAREIRRKPKSELRKPLLTI